MLKFFGARGKEAFISRMKAEIPWRKRKRGVHQSDESRNPVEEEEKWCSAVG
ncbi:hypothetical protein M1D49_20230 [Bacillus sp. PK3-056]|uniref:hypothetical protein n=1 Tax=Niallia circulans TaxID=1397 RepID=UPI0019D19F9F|nr:hypothetical protein [Niallia circulans]